MEQTLGKRIVQHRKQLGMTQDQLAEKLGVTAQAVSKWENDQSCPDINMLPKLAELFSTTTDALLGHTPVFEAEVVEDEENDDKESGWEFHWDAGRGSTVGFAVFVLLVGGLLFAARFFSWEVGLWGIVWPAALLVFGFTALLRHFCFSNLVCTLLGGYFLINNLGVVEFSLDKSLIFPGMIILFGGSLLVDAMRKPKKGRVYIDKKGGLDRKTHKHFEQEGEQFACSLSFGETKNLVNLPRLSGGKASISFGEMKVDLTGCGEIADGCVIETTVSFGELTLIVPKECYVENAVGAGFGDISVHGRPDQQPKGTITLTGGVSFGELEIHYV